jgi:FAD/FMN-containing dehydrogenase
MAIYSDSVSALRDRFGSAALFPGDPGYDDARRVWNGVIDRHPAVIVRVSTADEVVAAIAYAREHRLAIAVRGGGHNVAGSAVNDGGLVIDLSPMRAVRADPARGTVTAQGGATWGDVDRATTPHGRAVPGGVVSATGIAGLSLGGGYSHQRRRDGMTIDNLVSAEVVLADGRVVRASEDEHADLFWALRGGRETLGVVTEFEYRMHPIGPEVLSMHVAYPVEAIDVVFARYRELVAGAPDALSTALLVWNIPPVPGLPEEIVGLPYVGVVGVYAGPVAEGEAAIAAYREIAEPIADLTHVAPYLEEQAALDPLFADGQRYFWKSLFTAELSEGAMDVIKRQSLERPSPQTLMIIRHLGGAISRVPADATAFGDRSAQFLVSIDSTWQQAADDLANIRELRLRRRRRAARPRARDQGRLRPRGGLLAPGEDGLLEVVDAFADPPEQPDLAQLEEHGRGGRVDEVVAERQLQHWPVALGDVDEARLAGAQRVEADAVDGEDLVGRGLEMRVGAAPQHDGRDHVARAGGVVVEPADDAVGRQAQGELLVELAQRRVERLLARVEPAAR